MSMSKPNTRGLFRVKFSGPSLSSCERDEHRRKGCENEPAQPTRQQPAPARWGEHAKYSSQTFPCSSSSAAA